MIISSTLLALNLQMNFEEIEKANICTICIIQECSSGDAMLEISEALVSRTLGKVLPIHCDDSDTAFLIVLENLHDGLRIVKRLLWESGLLLSSKIVLIKPEIRLLKEYGEGE
jgi:hypothetical protein